MCTFSRSYTNTTLCSRLYLPSTFNVDAIMWCVKLIFLVSNNFVDTLNIKTISNIFFLGTCF